MRRRVRLLLLLLLAGAAVVGVDRLDAEVAGGAGAERLKLRMAFDDSVYQVGQPIVYVVTLENISDTVVDNVPEIDTSANGYSVVVEREGEGKPLARAGFFKDVIHLGPGMSIAPGHCLTASDDLLYQTEGGRVPPGRYRVQCIFTPSIEARVGARFRGARSEGVWITIRDHGPRELSAAYADSVLGGIADQVARDGTTWGAACAVALREHANTSAYWYLLERSRGTLDSGQLAEILNAVSEGGGGPVRRAVILDQALAGGVLRDAAEIQAIAATMAVPGLERCVVGSWGARYAQGRFLPARGIKSRAEPKRP